MFILFFRYVKDGGHLHLLGQKMEDLIFNVADSNFFFNDLEECDQVLWGFGAQFYPLGLIS